MALGVALATGLMMTGCGVGLGDVGASEVVGTGAIFVGTTGGLMAFVAVGVSAMAE